MGSKRVYFLKDLQSDSGSRSGIFLKNEVQKTKATKTEKSLHEGGTELTHSRPLPALCTIIQEVTEPVYCNDKLPVGAPFVPLNILLFPNE